MPDLTKRWIELRRRSNKRMERGVVTYVIFEFGIREWR